MRVAEVFCPWPSIDGQCGANFKTRGYLTLLMETRCASGFASLSELRARPQCKSLYPLDHCPEDVILCVSPWTVISFGAQSLPNGGSWTLQYSAEVTYHVLWENQLNKFPDKARTTQDNPSQYCFS